MTKHVSVMPQKAIELLDVRSEGIYVDGTLGRGGHARLILEKLDKGRLYGFDLDEQAIAESKENLKEYDNITYIHDNFMNIADYVDQADGILLDLGVSSPQFDEAERGFSYRYDGPLDMRMNQESELTAYEVVNTYTQEQLSEILWKYGEERNARKIARKICEERPINSTLQLVEVIKKALPARELAKKGHPAKQTFQAIRIEVNQELASLEKFLDSIDGILKQDGRVVIITFHSLEDRMVKQYFKKLSSVDDDKRIALRPEDVRKPDYILLNHGVKADEEEIASNRRAKSAIIRGIKKTNGKSS